MHDIVLVVPRKDYNTDSQKYRRMEIFPPTGLLYLGGALKKEGIKTTLLDTYALSLTLEESIKRIKKERPKIIGIGTYSDFIRGSVQLAEAIRQEGINSVIAIGGPHVSATPDFFNEFPLFDFAITGESEITFTKIAKEILNGGHAKGVIDGECATSLDDLPLPDRDLIDDETRNCYYSGSYTGFAKTSIHSSRGCPFGCIFCSNIYKKVRYHSSQRVIEEVELCINKYKTKNIAFTDDCFTLKKERAFDICNLMKKKRLDVEWTAVTRADCLNKDLLKAMKDSGCSGITIGVESGSEEMRLKILKKGIKDKDVLEVKKWCDELGITCPCFFMAGFPGETLKDLQQTVKFARKVKTIFFANTMTICYPGTEIWEMAVKESKYPADYWHRFAKGKVEDKMPLYYPAGFNRDEFLELTKRMVYKYYLHPRYIPIALKFAFSSYANFKSMAIYLFEFTKHLIRKFILRRKSVLR